MRYLALVALLAVGCVTADDHAPVDHSLDVTPPDQRGAVDAGTPDTGTVAAADADFSAVPTCAAWETPGRTLVVSRICDDQVHAVCLAFASATDPGPHIGPCSLYDGQNRHLICELSCD